MTYVKSRAEVVNATLALLIARIHITLIFYPVERPALKRAAYKSAGAAHFSTPTLLPIIKVNSHDFFPVTSYLASACRLNLHRELYILESTRHVVNVGPDSEVLFEKDLITRNVENQRGLVNF